MTFDKQGNLWVADPLNNRVVRFPASALSAGTMEPSADFVLGQITFDTNTVLANRTRLTKTTLIQPSGLAFSEAGDLYVSDFDNRVLYFKGPVNSNGQAATRVLGMPTPTTSDPSPAALNGCPTAPPQPCESALGVLNGSKPPQGVAVLNNSVYVADSGNNRIVKYDTPDKWGAECVFTPALPCASGTLISPPGILFIGQPSGQTTKANQGGVPSASTLAQPVGLAFQGTDLWVVDASNNRVLDLPQAGGGSYRRRDQSPGTDRLHLQCSQPDRRPRTVHLRSRDPAGRGRNRGGHDLGSAASLHRRHIQQPHSRVQGRPQGEAGRHSRYHHRTAQPMELHPPTTSRMTQLRRPIPPCTGR